MARYVASVHYSQGRFSPILHQNIGQKAHHQLSLNIQRFVIDFFVEIASSVGEESSGRHRNRNEEENIAGDAEDANETAVIFLPSMYSLRFLYRLYTKKIEGTDYSTAYLISWRSFRRICNEKELSWLRIRGPRDDVCDEWERYRRKMAHLLKKQEQKATLEELEEISSEFVKHRNLAVATRKVYKAECKRASDGAQKIQQYLNRSDINQEIVTILSSKYEAHYSFDFSQSLWLPQLAETPGTFYLRRKRSINIEGIVDDGGTGSPIQTNMLYDQTIAGKGSSEVVSMLYLFLVHKRHHFFASRKIYFHADNCAGRDENCTVVQFFIWCVAVGIVDHVEFKFLLKGHTKFS